MTDNQIFRLVLIAGFAILMPASMYFRVKSQASRESLDRRPGVIRVVLGCYGLPSGSEFGYTRSFATAVAKELRKNRPENRSSPMISNDVE